MRMCKKLLRRSETHGQIQIMTEDPAPARQPQAARPQRVAELATLPIFLKAQGRRVVLAGGAEALAWKAELVAAAGAEAHIFAPAPHDSLAALAGERANISLHARNWRADDLAGALAAICDETIDAPAFQAAAREAGVPLNAIDQPAFCDFQFGSIVNRSPLVIAISTDGAAPVFGQTLRAKIETLLPQGFQKWAQAARRWRADIAALELDFRARKSFWERFTALALARPNDTPRDSDRDALLADRAPSAGKAWLIGAGPGDPELLTLRAVRALQSADVVLYDDLVSPGVLDLARREAQRVNVGKRGFKPSCGQDDICTLLVDLVRAGKVVARLKGGDPMIFGRANEEIAALRGAGLEVEVTPGVTAASAASAGLLASLTARDSARRVQFVTAHARQGGLPDDLDWRALADPMAATCVYMGVKTLPLLTARLMVEGLSGATPAIVVERISWPDERRFASALENIASRVAAAQPKGPCLLLIGQAFANARI
jgi:uroporphyrin-III C-methyltransferase/precorrin-2 dehydrogenase/sirohydrochlorin ferrochelatase